MVKAKIGEGPAGAGVGSRTIQRGAVYRHGVRPPRSNSGLCLSWVCNLGQGLLTSLDLSFLIYKMGLNDNRAGP